MTLYRPITTADDRRFVLSAWSSSYKRSHHAGLITSEDWTAIMHGQIGKIIDRPTTRTIIAYSLPSTLIAFISGDTSHQTPVVHYVYVKDPYRSEAMVDADGFPVGPRTGPRHARALFRELGVDPTARFLFTCRTYVCTELQDKIPAARFTPAAARYTDYHEHQERHR